MTQVHVFEIGDQNKHGATRITQSNIAEVTRVEDTLHVRLQSNVVLTFDMTEHGAQSLWDAYKPTHQIEMWSKHHLPDKPVIIRDAKGNIVYPEQDEQAED